MRVFILATLSFSIIFSTRANSLYQGRGFEQGKCYQHMAIRHCNKEKCSLEVFPSRTGALHFPIAKADPLYLTRAGDDFGRFLFKIEKLGLEKGKPKVSVISIGRILLSQWQKKQDESLRAVEIKCPDKT